MLQRVPGGEKKRTWQSVCRPRCDLAAQHSKANKEARLVERKVCFISEASSKGVWVGVEAGEGRGLSKGQIPNPSTIRGQEFL